MTILLTSCGNSNQVVLVSGKDKLNYECKNFRAQAETPQQLQIIAQAYVETLTHAAQNQNIVTMEALQAAEGKADWRTMERLIVEYRCSHKKDFKK